MVIVAPGETLTPALGRCETTRPTCRRWSTGTDATEAANPAERSMASARSRRWPTTSGTRTMAGVRAGGCDETFGAGGVVGLGVGVGVAAGDVAGGLEGGAADGVSGVAPRSAVAGTPAVGEETAGGSGRVKAPVMTASNQAVPDNATRATTAAVPSQGHRRSPRRRCSPRAGARW